MVLRHMSLTSVPVRFVLAVSFSTLVFSVAAILISIY